ncbi:Plasmodium vivax Vir protein, putative [Plasmodium vivax]|nr:Plasmodium vivax Vir protein, putative [Plasmodium vivax]
MILICKKYHRFLDKCLEWSGPNPQYNVSLLLNYWLYDKLSYICGAENTEEMNIGFSALQGIWDNFFYNQTHYSYCQKCKPEPKLVNHEDWGNRKKLYYYYIDYDTLFGYASSYFPKCEENYKKIKEFSSLYKYFQEHCSTEGYSCPEFFHNFKKENPEYKSENLLCHTKMEQEIAAAAMKDSFSHLQSGSERRSGAPSDDLGSPRSELGTPHRETTTETSGIGKNVTHTVLGAAPVLLTATALYRYTPLGPWIRRLGGGRTNTMNAVDTFSPYIPETGDMFSDDTANYISYQPM